jgi:hypothetical protein
MRLTGPASLHAAPARAGTARMWCSPVPYANCEIIRSSRRLTIEATVSL